MNVSPSYRKALGFGSETNWEVLDINGTYVRSASHPSK